MKNITTEIIIHAPKEVVWEEIMNFSAYPMWNPFIKEISGDAQVGKQLRVQIQPPGQKGMQFTPYVLVCKEGEEFRWLGKTLVKGLFDGEHSFVLEAISAEQTRFLQAESFSGILSGLLFRLFGQSTQQGFQAMNEALKKRAEEYYKSRIQKCIIKY